MSDTALSWPATALDGDARAGADGYYPTSRRHILAELERIDLLIRAQVWRLRQVQHTDGELRGFYISEEEVDSLLARPAGLPAWADDPDLASQEKVWAALDRIAAGIAARKARTALLGIGLRLDHLARLFDLTPFEIDALLVCLAPELDLRYERLYAYLQDDITRKRPTVDLVLNLLCRTFDAKLAERESFIPGSRLLKHHLLVLFDDPAQPHPPLLGRTLKVDDRVVSYLLDADPLDARLEPYAGYVEPDTPLDSLVLPVDVRHRLALLAHEAAGEGETLVFYFQGPYGAGRQAAAGALCYELGMGLLVVDGRRLLAADGLAFDMAVRLAVREAALRGAALYWDGFDALLAEDGASRLEMLLHELDARRAVAFLAGNVAWEPQAGVRGLPFIRVELPDSTTVDRVQLWAGALGGHLPPKVGAQLKILAGKFRLTPGQIRDAAATARNLARWRDPYGAQITLDDLYAACRLHSNRKLAAIAQRITPHYAWTDIVLPVDQVRQLREMCNYVKHRPTVFEDWGFDRKLSLGKGLNALFSGPSGTGKTMAAEIVAHELGVDLYKIDLSTVVSKYIGETEKNLARIFAEAEASNALLFFDEADALFGKRSEVKDAHDRYANIEISYLLQKMEEYEGITVLATNLRRNIDDAFVRRLAFTVHFPFPEEKDRLRIWQGIWPAEMALADDVDLPFMARQFKLAGGNIKNIALAAAFLAAEDGQAVEMRHLIWATKREFQKTGKTSVEAEFGPYFSLIE